MRDRHRRAARWKIDASVRADYAALREAVTGMSQQLAQKIIRDGEGATKFITITVEEGSDASKNAARSPIRSPIRHWSRPHFSPPTRTWAASWRRSAMPASTTSMSASSTCTWTMSGSRRTAAAIRTTRKRTASA